ncbi:hypothetical protein NZ698_09060 [Chryseobacterium sp. PBS4-4]|uniref:Tetratricopeptide repeat protein n=1 Tax=Chryseobacterium edaphi TaxID=2976532 RepID=A0ABT2W564_9FLAO|nr:hypothetical protein [Chryseobacterium edaphi]MCU7617347.1 hypothetical protein [Chryseobacterium edaphi]
MINNRVLELLKNPKNIQSEDLHLLKEEINSFPYIQNIRALHLYGVHLYDKENYQKTLSSTAAYTTDKKILYQLINGKIQQVKPQISEPVQEIIPEKIIETPTEDKQTVSESESLTEENVVRTTPKSFSDHDYEAASEGLIADKPEIKHIVVDGERNRILFDGEENFLEEDNNETIDLESTLESGVIVTQKPVSNQNSLTQTDKEEAIVAEELAGTSSETENSETSALAETQVEEITDNAELNLEEEIQSEEILAQTTGDSESDFNKTEQLETPKSEVIINENKTDSEKIEETVYDEAEISFQKVESFSAETENKVEETTDSDLNKTEEISEIPKSEIIINEDKIDSEKVEAKVNNETEISFQKVESFSTETAIPNDENIQSDLNDTEGITEVLNPELIVEEEKIESEQVSEKINDDSELSFHATDSFLPEVKIESNKTPDNLPSEAPKPSINKHEDEMRRLIEEVEKRMKANKENAPEKTEAKDEEVNHDISFAETQAFHVGEEQKTAEEVVVKEAELIVEEKLEEEKSVENTNAKDLSEPEIPANPSWKPMSFETSRPDSLLSKPIEVPQPKEEIQKAEEAPKPEPIVEEILKDNQVKNTIEVVDNLGDYDELKETEKETPEKQNGEAPVMNVSFFGSDIASLGLSYKSDQKEKADAKEEAKIAQQKIDDSNVPGFINTWQSWLKIDREEAPVDKTEIKNKVIESFIENNPKISQLKDEVNFVVKEKTDDISHLMTETLANLYIEQKLYSKAVNAFLILANKFPDRKEYFEAKIQEIKDSRNKN